MSKTRLNQSLMLACITAVAACTGTGSDEGPAGNTTMNVVIPDANATDVQTVEYTIRCTGNDQTYLSNTASFDNLVVLNGNLEVLEPGQAFPEPIPAEAEVRQGFMDLPPGPCTAELRARDSDGEVLCTAQEPFTVNADDNTVVPILLICGLSFQADVGTADILGTFQYNVANFCPDLFVLNCLESLPTSPTADPAVTTCEVRARDGDKQCGESCDPQSCVAAADDSGLVCTPAADPSPDPGVESGLATTVTCVGATISCPGNEDGNGGCLFEGDLLGTLPTNQPIIGNPATFDVVCDQLAGAAVTCTAVSTDGDTDCIKTKEVSFQCPGANFCDEPTTDCSPAANLPLEQQECNTGSCNRTDQQCEFAADPNEEGQQCANNVPGDTQSGRCSAPDATTGLSTCEDFGCTSDADCELDGNDCTGPPLGACQPDGNCLEEVPLSDTTACNAGGQGTGSGTCDGGGTCVDNCAAEDCDDGDPCTTDTCDPFQPAGQRCSNSPALDGTDCIPPNPSDPSTCLGACGACDTGVCVERPVTCDIVERKAPAECQSRELLALDCFLLGSGAPLILDPVITQTAPAFAGVDVAVVPVLALALPGSLVCGFASVLPGADVFNSAANLNLLDTDPLSPPDPTPSTIGLNSFLNGSTPHSPVNFNFTSGCGNQAGACGAVNPGLCNASAVPCTNDDDCAGTGPGVVVPFVAGSPTSSPLPVTVNSNSATPGAVFFSYGTNDLEAYVGTDLGVLCLGGAADSPPGGASCAFRCAGADRNGDSIPLVPLRGFPFPPGPDDSPRVMIDANCDKLGVAACGGTTCDTLSEPCPLAAAGQQCVAIGGGTAGFCINVNTGTCAANGQCLGVGPLCTVDDDCDAFLASQGVPTCCEPFFDFSQAANVCATGQPGSALATTEAPCNGQDGTTGQGLRCEGRVTCGSCGQVTGTAPDGTFPVNGTPWPIVETCSAVPGNGDVGTCENSDGQVPCPNGDSDCTDGDDDYCIIPCATNTCDTGDRQGATCLRDVDCQRCTGGGNDGGNCTGDADCPGACQGGFDDQQLCGVDADCRGECQGAPAACTADADCGPFGPCLQATCGAAGACDPNPGTCNIVGCDADSCCTWVTDNYPNALLTDFPVLPVNP